MDAFNFAFSLFAKYRGAGRTDCNLCLCGGDELHPAGPAVMLNREFAKLTTKPNGVFA
jgi:hypothetical protein